MSLRDTRDIGTAKIVMLGGGGGGGSYTAGSGISISNSVITNIRKGALTGVVDSISGNIAHTQITGARDTFAAGALILLQSEAAGTANNLRIQYGAQSSDSQTFAIYDTSGTAASVTIASGDTVIMMIDNTGYRAIILNVLSASGGCGYAGLGIGKKKTVTNNIIDTDIDLHRAPIVGDRLLVYFDATVQNPTGLTTYNNGTAVTSNLEPVTPMYINAGWNILEFKNDGFLYNNCWVRMQNVDVPTTLSGLSDTLINSPSDGQMLVYENNMWKNKTAVQANPTGTAVRELKKIQIGDNVFDTFGLKTFDVTSVTSGVSGAIAVDVITASQLNGEIIAIHTGSNTGSTGNAWTLALSDSQTVEALTMSKADGTAFTDALTANSLMFVKIDTSNDTAVVLGIVGAGSNVSANGSGSPASYLNKLKIGSAIYDTSAIRPFSVAQIANNTVKIFVADIDQLDGKVIALSTGALTGTTSSAWSLNMVDTSGGAVSLSVSMLNADGTAFTDDISANELLFVAIDLTDYEGTILSVVGKSEDEIKTATGNPITITDALAGNAIEVSAEIVATQSGSGTPSPTNVRPISGFSSVTITREDAQGQTATVTVALGQTVYGGTLDLTSGVLTVDKGIADLGSLDWWRSTSYTNAFFYANISDSVADGDNNIISSCYETIESRTSGQFGTIAENGQIAKSSNSIQVFVRDDSYNDASAFKTARTGEKVVYELATPTTTTLTPAQLALVNGYNQLTCNSGDMEITYKASGLDALKERVDELEDRVDDLTVSDLADTAITTPTNGQVLGYNSTSGKWENQNPSGGEVYFDQTATLSTSTTTTITFTESEITTSSVIDIAVSVWGLTPEDVTVSTGVCTVIMPKVSTAQTIAVRIYVR